MAVSVHEGNVADSTTFLPEVQRLRERFGIEQLVMVGDRGMVGNASIAQLREMAGIDWITALKGASIRTLVEQGQLQLGLFDERNLLEIASPQYPGERLVACRNPQLAALRAHKRQELLSATERNLQPIKDRVDAGRLKGAEAIALRVGKVIRPRGRYTGPALDERHLRPDAEDDGKLPKASVIEKNRVFKIVE